MCIRDSPYTAEDILANMMEVLDDDNSTAMAIRKYIKGKSNTFTCIEKLSFSSARKLSACLLYTSIFLNPVTA